MLVSKCLCDRLHYEENGVKVSIKPEDGEKVLFFGIDNEYFRELIYRDPNKGKVCDLLVYYRGANATNDIFCFVELKKDIIIENLDDAVKQLIAAKQGFKWKLKEISRCNKPIPECRKRSEPIRYFSNSITWLAYVCYKHMSAPINTSLYRNKLKEQKTDGKIFDDAIVLANNDIGGFLREHNR